MNFIARFIATGFFVGYAPIAPGTVGSILGLFLYWLIPFRNFEFLLFTIIAFFIGVAAATGVEKYSGIKDNQIIVIDEIVGIFVTFLFFEGSWGWLIFGCFLFRFFDITKINPTRKLEKLPSGWGVMADDVMAGIYSLATLHLFKFIADLI